MVRRTPPMTGQLTLDDCQPDWPDPDTTTPADMNPPIPPRENRATRRAKQRAARRKNR